MIEEKVCFSPFSSLSFDFCFSAKAVYSLLIVSSWAQDDIGNCDTSNYCPNFLTVLIVQPRVVELFFRDARPHFVSEISPAATWNLESIFSNSSIY